MNLPSSRAHGAHETEGAQRESELGILDRPQRRFYLGSICCHHSPRLTVLAVNGTAPGGHVQELGRHRGRAPWPGTVVKHVTPRRTRSTVRHHEARARRPSRGSRIPR